MYQSYIIFDKKGKLCSKTRYCQIGTPHTIAFARNVRPLQPHKAITDISLSDSTKIFILIVYVCFIVELPSHNFYKTNIVYCM